MPLPRNQVYIPSPENDAAHLNKWAEDAFRTGIGLSEMGKRYHAALTKMHAHEAVRFLAMMLLHGGQQLPPFPDQM